MARSGPIAVFASIIVGGVTGAALADQTVTGCLNTSSGKLSSLQIGDEPLRRCPRPTIKVQLPLADGERRDKQFFIEDAEGQIVGKVVTLLLGEAIVEIELSGGRNILVEINEFRVRPLLGTISLLFSDENYEEAFIASVPFVDNSEYPNYTPFTPYALTPAPNLEFGAPSRLWAATGREPSEMVARSEFGGSGCELLVDPWSSQGSKWSSYSRT